MALEENTMFSDDSEIYFKGTIGKERLMRFSRFEILYKNSE